MNTLEETIGDILPPNPIRVETALSRYPVHRLAKHGDIAIDIHEKNEHGELSIKWEVNYPKKPGQPGPLAYKIDTLIINRRIEEATRPIPRIIRLGSLKEIAAQLELGGDTNIVKNALRQNAFAGIMAKIRYRQNDGRERTLEADFTRYSVVFTGEELPDGRKADAVHIVLNDIYIKVINGAMTRPLDYDYLKSLPPTPQRFYELLSYQMYAAIKNDRHRAKLMYSGFCTYAPQTRYSSFDQVKKQMYKIHTHHRKSGYIAKIDFNEIADNDGNPDWEMLYQPGPKARAEFRAFTKRGGPVMLEVEPFTADPMPQIAPSQPTPLEAELIGHGISDAIARQLAAEHAEEKIRQQIEILDWRLSGKKADKIDDPAAWLVSAIKSPTGHAAPKGFVSKAERQRRDDAKKAKEREAAEERRRKQQEEAAERAKQKRDDAYWASLTPDGQAELDEQSRSEADPETLAQEKGPFKATMQRIRRNSYIRHLLDSRDSTPAKA